MLACPSDPAGLRPARPPGPAAELGGQRVIDTVLPSIAVAIARLAGPRRPASWPPTGRRGSCAASPPRRSARRPARRPAGGNLAIGVIGSARACRRRRLARHRPAGQRRLFALAFLLGTVALFAIGLFIAALAPTTRAANAIGTLVFFPSMFFAGALAARVPCRPGCAPSATSPRSARPRSRCRTHGPGRPGTGAPAHPGAGGLVAGWPRLSCSAGSSKRKGQPMTVPRPTSSVDAPTGWSCFRWPPMSCWPCRRCSSPSPTTWSGTGRRPTGWARSRWPGWPRGGCCGWSPCTPPGRGGAG